MINSEIRRILDFTLLNVDVTKSQLIDFCNVANRIGPKTVCVFPENAEFVKSFLDEEINLALVSHPFPVGSDSIVEIRKNVSEAVNFGADEIDCVLEPRDVSDFPSEVELEKLVEMRDSSNGRVLKVIIEAPQLREREMRAVIRMVLASGADFVKSGTGRRGICTKEQAIILAEEVCRHNVISGEYKGIKLAGGIKTREDVDKLIGAIYEIDREIIDRGLLRIGTSAILA